MYNRRLVVGVDDNGSGEVYYLDLLPTGDVSGNTYSKKFDGFGEIVELNYRNPFIVTIKNTNPLQVLHAGGG